MSAVHTNPLATNERELVHARSSRKRSKSFKSQRDCVSVTIPKEFRLTLLLCSVEMCPRVTSIMLRGSFGIYREGEGRELLMVKTPTGLAGDRVNVGSFSSRELEGPERERERGFA